MSLPSNRLVSLATLLMVASALGACAGTSPANDPEPLWGSEWQLQDMGGQPVSPQPMATLGFPKNGQAAGNGSCNRFFGPVEIQRDHITFGPLASTKMACLGVPNQQESRYLSALQKAQRYEVQGDTLLIHVQDMDQPLRFVRSAPQR